MTIRLEAERLVESLLEADPTNDPPAGKVRLRPPAEWRIFKEHGVKRFLERVDEGDKTTFVQHVYLLRGAEIFVPARERWVLKMPNGYGIFGEGDEGASVVEKRRVLSIRQNLVENPNMTPEDNARWERARKSL